MNIRIWICVIIISFNIQYECDAQIQIQNNSLEGTTGVGIVPSPWLICEGSPDTDPDFIVPESLSFPPFDGNSYCGIFAYPTQSNYHETISQKLKCPLKSGALSIFTLYSGFIEYLNSTTTGYLNVYGGYNFCDTSQLLWSSGNLEPQWKQYSISFTPNENYTFLIFRPFCESLFYPCYIVIDNLPPEITILNGEQVLAHCNSSEIYNGDCVALTADVTDSPVSIQWYSIPSGFSSNQLNAGSACPLQDTKYIVATSDTCGIMSYDTVEVKIKKPVVSNFFHPGNVAGEDKFLIRGVYPNSEVTIYNSIGQLIYHSSDYKNDFSLINLPSAMYFYLINYSDGTKEKGKFEIW